MHADAVLAVLQLDAVKVQLVLGQHGYAASEQGFDGAMRHQRIAPWTQGKVRIREHSDEFPWVETDRCRVGILVPAHRLVGAGRRRGSVRRLKKMPHLVEDAFANLRILRAEKVGENRPPLIRVPVARMHGAKQFVVVNELGMSVETDGAPWFEEPQQVVRVEAVLVERSIDPACTESQTAELSRLLPHGMAP